MADETEVFEDYADAPNVQANDTSMFGEVGSLSPLNPIGFRHSKTIGKLVEALAKASLEFGEIKKETENPYFKSTYADLATLIAATRPALGKHGLVVVQMPRTKDSVVEVTTALLHSSDEWIAEDLAMRPTKLDPQGCGSAMTYARRYGYQAILNVAGEVDDDGNAASGKTAKSEKIIEAEDRFLAKTGQVRSSPSLVAAFAAMFKTSGKTPEQLATILRTRYSAESPADLTSDELSELVKWAASKEPLQTTLETSVAAATEAKGRTLDASVSQDTSRKGITEKQISRLFAIAREHGKPEADIRQYVKESYGLESLKDLNRPQYDHVVRWTED